MDRSFKCPVCHNSNPRYIGIKNGQPYCRKCISFQGEKAKEVNKRHLNVTLNLRYPLTEEQKAISSQLIENYFSGLDSLIYAVCGAGKTELTFHLIARAISLGQSVAFALPRRDVAMELYERLKDAFNSLKVIAVYGGHHEELEGDLIVLTTHQLYRYEKYFDLIIMDEIDAFPYKGDDVLNAMFYRALRGHYVLLTATPSDAQIKEYQQEGKALLELRTRFHKKPIPVPKPVALPAFCFFPYLVKKLLEYRKKDKPCLVFVPSTALAEDLYRRLRLLVKDGNFVSSKVEERAKIISDFKKGKYKYLVTTAVLERGITIKGLQILIYEAENSIYDKASLIQIAGRAGRKIGATDGEVIFITKEVTTSQQEAIREIEYCNSFLPGVF